MNTSKIKKFVVHPYVIVLLWVPLILIGVPTGVLVLAHLMGII